VQMLVEQNLMIASVVFIIFSRMQLLRESNNMLP